MDVRGWGEASSVRWSPQATPPFQGNPWAALGTQGRVFHQRPRSERERCVLWETPLRSEPLEEGTQERGVAM